MENHEFLIDHHPAAAAAAAANRMGDEDDYEDDHSQSSVVISGGGANNNLLLGDSSVLGSAAANDGTFLLDDEEEVMEHGTRQQQQQQPPPPSKATTMFENDDDDDVVQQHPSAAVVTTGIASHHSSSTDDFEFIATPQSSTTDRDVKMDNLLDFEQAPPPMQSATAPQPSANLVETLLTAEDVKKPRQDLPGAYLENEFTQFSDGLRKAGEIPQDFQVGGKPVKDVYNDFMEAERGGRGDSQPKKLEPSIETISSSTPVAAPFDDHHQQQPPQRVKLPQPDSDEDDEDLLEQFSAPVVPERKVEEPKKIVMDEPPTKTAPIIPVVAPVAVPLPVKAEEHFQKKDEEKVEVVSKPAVITTPSPPAVVVQKSNKPAAAAATKEDELITTSAEEMFCKFGLDAWFKPERLHPKVESLIYWRDVKKSGIVCAAGLVLLLAMSCFSVISVFAWVSLLALAGTVAFRIYKSVMQAVQKTSDGHPFKAFLDFELQLPQEKVQQVSGVAVSHINSVLAELRRLFLVEDLIDSVKFGLMLWCLTYVGAWFNGMTLVILSYVALFTLPKVYEMNKTEIDAHLDVVRSKINEITEKVKAAIPIGKKAAVVESEKDK